MSNSREILSKIINDVLSGKVESANRFYNHLNRHPNDVSLLDLKLKEIETKCESERSDSIHETVFLGMAALYKKDYLKALQYFEQGAKLNNNKCYSWIGQMYEDGLGVKANLDSAMNYYQIAAKYEDPFSQNRLGVYYFYQSTTSSYQKAFEYFQSAAKQNNEYAYLNLGIMYQSGRGVDVDLVNAEKCYQLAKNLGNVPAITQLGLIYLSRAEYKKAITYFEMAAEQHDGNAFMHLGTMYENGTGFKQDNGIAAKYYRIAVEKNVESAELHLKSLNDYRVAVTYHKTIALKTPRLISQFNFVASSYGEEFDNLAYQDSWETIKPILNQVVQDRVGERQSKQLSDSYKALKEFLPTDLINIIYMYFYYGNEMHLIKKIQEHIAFEENIEKFKNDTKPCLSDMALLLDKIIGSINDYMIGPRLSLIAYGHYKLFVNETGQKYSFVHSTDHIYLNLGVRSKKKRKVPEVTVENKIDTNANPTYAKNIMAQLLKQNFFAQLDNRHNSRKVQQDYDKKVGMVRRVSAFKK